MKTQSHLFLLAGAVLTMMLAWLPGAAVHAAPPPRKRTPAAHASDTNAIPRSVYIVPTSPAQGRDPFFPDSTRLFHHGEVRPENFPKVSLVYNGLSGTPDNKLAIINGHTFAEGETAEVNTSSGRVKVRCLKIARDSVVVEVGGQERTLKFQAGQ